MNDYLARIADEIASGKTTNDEHLCNQNCIFFAFFVYLYLIHVSVHNDS